VRPPEVVVTGKEEGGVAKPTACMEAKFVAASTFTKLLTAFWRAVLSAVANSDVAMSTTATRKFMTRIMII
jgi:hypothetical protein